MQLQKLSYVGQTRERSVYMEMPYSNMGYKPNKKKITRGAAQCPANGLF